MKNYVTILIAESDFNPDAKSILAEVGRVVEFKSREQFLRNLAKADAVIAGLQIRFDKSMFQRARCLRLLASRTTQMRHIDLVEARRRGIAVIHIKGNARVLKNVTSTAEETMALSLSLMRNIPWAFDSVKACRWERRKYGGHEARDKRMGVIGFGRLGRHVARYARTFGMHVIARDPFVSRETMARRGVEKVSLEKLLRISDIVSLHSVYNEETRGMLRRRHFRLMKPSAIFINTARGEITNEHALLEALRKKWIAGAALDTLSGETPEGSHLKRNALVQYAKRHENLIIVPHLGGATAEATERTMVYIARLARNWIMRHVSSRC